MLKARNKAKVILTRPHAICLDAHICTPQGCTGSHNLNFQWLTGTLIGYLLLISPTATSGL